MSDTPRTDSAYFRPHATMYDVAGEMKQLERELNAANERIKRLEAFLAEVSRRWECECRFTVWDRYDKRIAECDCCRAERLLNEDKP